MLSLNILTYPMNLLSAILVWVFSPQQKVLLEINVIIYFIVALMGVGIEVHDNALGQFIAVFYVGLHVFDLFPFGVHSLSDKHVD